ncbi:aminotransferase class IV, partial [Gammaproteobacteria bacterium]|nr:aminotransferase class IV [Gammaproteobacteria bacterium]
YSPKNQTKLSILDRGFLFGDGVYELIPIYNKHIFYIENHLNRLKSSLELINIDSSIVDDDEFTKIIKSLISLNSYVNHHIYIHISRGVDKKRNHIYTKESEPTILIMGENYQPFDKKTIKSGKSAIIEEDYRWLKSNIKSTSLLANVLIKNKAFTNDAYEALLLRDDYLTEGSASNVFIVDNGVIKTPKLSNKLLPGITRKFLTDLIEENSLKFEECDISKDALLTSDEIFCSSSTNPVVPITQVDNISISNNAGPVSMELYEHSQQFIKDSYK